MVFSYENYFVPAVNSTAIFYQLLYFTLKPPKWKKITPNNLPVQEWELLLASPVSPTHSHLGLESARRALREKIQTPATQFLDSHKTKSNFHH